MSIRILIVDDQQDIRDALQLNLNRMNAQYNVHTASDGFEALDILREMPFDLIITDYMMPGMDGIELIESVRVLSPNIQIIVTSALQSETLINLLKKADITRFLSKPFSSNDVRDIVTTALAELEATKKVQQTTSASAPLQLFIKPELNTILQELRYQVGAHSCLVVESAGYIIGSDGDDAHMPLASLATLLAANALATAEISRLLGNPAFFQSTIHEGEYFNEASYILDKGRILVIVFSKYVKIGLVQYYARQTIPILSDALPPPETKLNDNAFLNYDFVTSIDNSLDELFVFDDVSSID